MSAECEKDTSTFSSEQDPEEEASLLSHWLYTLPLWTHLNFRPFVTITEAEVKERSTYFQFILLQQCSEFLMEQKAIIPD